MIHLLGSKKGQAQNYIAVVMFLFVLAIVTMISTVIYLGIIAGFTSAGLYTGAVEIAGTGFLRALTIYDPIMAVVLVSLLIAVGMTSFRLNTAPMFFIITLMQATFTGLVSYFFNYMFVQIIGQDAFAGVLVLFPRMILICSNLHWIGLIAMVIGSITLYAKKEKGQFEEP